jgi:geranylgeranyl pyrophosphate synthase
MASHLATQSAVSDSLPSCIEAKVADTQIVAASRTQPGTDHLVPVHGFLSRPGKRIRACLLQAGFELAGGRGKPPELMLDFVELLHAGSLVIDDIEDDSDSRRGQPTLHRQLGIPIALNAGNWMYFSALEKLTQLKGPAHRLLSIQRQTIRTIRRCHEGQAIDLSTRADQLTAQDLQVTARQITRLKTGELTGLAARLGACWATSDREKLRRVQRFGIRLGTALQMQNDYQELVRCAVQGQPSDDLTHRRVTWPWAWAAATIPSNRLKKLQASLADESIPRSCLASTLLSVVKPRAIAAIEGAKNRAIEAIEAIGEIEHEHEHEHEHEQGHDQGLARSEVLQSIFRKLRC